MISVKRSTGENESIAEMAVAACSPTATRMTMSNAFDLAASNLIATHALVMRRQYAAIGRRGMNTTYLRMTKIAARQRQIHQKAGIQPRAKC